MSQKTRKHIGFLLALTLVLSSILSLCEAPFANAAQKTKLKTKNIKIIVGKKKKIVFKKKAKKAVITFKSKDKEIATVSKKGTVTGKKAGKTTIIVKQKNGKKTKKIGNVKVTVTAKTQKNDNKTLPTSTPGNTPSNPPANVPSSNPPGTNTQTPNENSTSIKVFMDDMTDDNLIAEINGPGTVPTPTPDASVNATETPVATPQVIYDIDFENGSTSPFENRGSATVSIENDGAESSQKSLKVQGRTATWNGTQIDISKVVEIGKQYDVTFWAKQTTGSPIKINTTFQYNDSTGSAKYDTQSSTEIESDTWTKISFKTQEIPEYTGSIALYWETPYDSDNLCDFYLDNFTMQGIVKTASDSSAPDLSAGLVKTSVGNPIVTSRLTADPYAMEYDGRIYVYGTNDSEQYEIAPDADNNYAKIKTLNCYSSADMVNWTDHGVISVAGSTGAAKWAGNSWAPAAAHKTINGKEKFFLYFANSANSIGVLTSDSPTGPWTDPVGKALIDRDTPGCSQSEVAWLFDPAVLVDDDGTGYLYFGGIGDTSGKADSFIKNPKCARVIKLGDDMVSTVGEAQMIDAPYMFEDSGINKIGGKYYYSYCTNWTDISGRDVPTANIGLMVSDNPMSGFKYVGTVLKNPGNYFGAYGNNHHCFTEFKGKHYAFYHTKKDTTALGTKADYRTTYVNDLNLGDNGDFTNKDGSVADTKMTVTGVSPAGVINPYDTVEAETFAIANKVATTNNSLESTNPFWNTANRSLLNAGIGSYVGITNVDFGATGASSMTLKMSDTTEVNYQDYPVTLKKKVTGEHTIYIVFGKENILIDSWKFSN